MVFTKSPVLHTFFSMHDRGSEVCYKPRGMIALLAITSDLAFSSLQNKHTYILILFGELSS